MRERERERERAKKQHARIEFLRAILYDNITIIATQRSKIYFVDTFGDFSLNFSHTFE